MLRAGVGLARAKNRYRKSERDMAGADYIGGSIDDYMREY